MKPYNQLEKRYLIEQRVQERIKKHGSIEKAIAYCKNRLYECEAIWSFCSYDCVGYGITANRLLIYRLEEQLILQNGSQPV